MWALQLLGNDSDADDALQEAFFRLWRRKEQINPTPTSMDAISMTAVKSACIDAIRRRNILQSESIEVAESAQATQVDEGNSDLVEEVRALIEHRLDSRAREILLLHDSLGYDYDEISSRLNISEAHARVILSRARKTIREAYREYSRGHTLI